MKVLIKYTQAGKYRDQEWESLTAREVGDIQAVTPPFAAQLIGQNKACLMKTDNDEIMFHA